MEVFLNSACMCSNHLGSIRWEKYLFYSTSIACTYMYSYMSVCVFLWMMYLYTLTHKLLLPYTTCVQLAIQASILEKQREDRRQRKKQREERAEEEEQFRLLEECQSITGRRSDGGNGEKMDVGDDKVGEMVSDEVNVHMSE